VLNGEILFHEFIEKTEEEKPLIKKKREEKRFVIGFLGPVIPFWTSDCNIWSQKCSHTTQ
jgi:hypothetical protein